MSTCYNRALVTNFVVLFLLFVHKTVGKFDPYADNGGTLVGELFSCLKASPWSVTLAKIWYDDCDESKSHIVYIHMHCDYKNTMDTTSIPAVW